MAERVPTSYANVEVVTKANIYFDGKVVSHTVLFADGSKKTLGIIYPGSFHFGTAAPERMQIVAGSCRARLDGEGEWKSHAEGDDFRIPANSGFDIAVESGTVEYICSFE